MKGRILFTVFAVLVCFSSNAQDAVTGLVRKISESQVSLDYSYVCDDGKAKFHGDGKLLMQGRSYLLEGDGLKIWCDGKARWTVDEVAKEVLIENADENDAVMVPMTVIAHIPELFTWSSGERTFVLVPKAGTKSDISELVLYFDSASVPVGAEIKIKGGVSTSFNINSIDFRPCGDMAPYSLSESSFDSSYIITDIRDM